MKISVFITNPMSKPYNFSEAHKKRLETALPDVEVTVHNTPKSFRDNLEDVDIVLVWFFNSNWIRKAKKLKWVATPAAGRDYLTTEFPEHVLFTTSTFHGEIIAETVLGAMLGFVRKLFWANIHQKDYSWPKEEFDNILKTLKGSHVVILGFGNIGIHIAKLAKPFGVKITGVKRTLIEPPEFFDKNDKIITIEELDSVLPQADHLVLALPRDETTNEIINKERLNLLPNTAFIYNVGRGNAIDEAALIDVLNNERINGAYLDVFEKEPLADDNPIRYCQNVILTPHSSTVAPSFLDLFVDEFIEKYKIWIKTNHLENQVS